MIVQRISVALGVAAWLAIGFTAASAESNPPGSYQKTCSGISVSGTTLKASCKTMNGQSVQTELAFYASCVGDLGNINGVLACAGPNGSYALTCEDATVKGDTLSARCKKKDGAFINTTLKGFQGFQGNINNCDGNLRNGNC